MGQIRMISSWPGAHHPGRSGWLPPTPVRMICIAFWDESCFYRLPKFAFESALVFIGTTRKCRRSRTRDVQRCCIFDFEIYHCDTCFGFNYRGNRVAQNFFVKAHGKSALWYPISGVLSKSHIFKHQPIRRLTQVIKQARKYKPKNKTIICAQTKNTTCKRYNQKTQSANLKTPTNENQRTTDTQKKYDEMLCLYLGPHLFERWLCTQVTDRPCITLISLMGRV